MSARKTNQSSQVLSCKHAPFVFNHTLSTSFSKHSFKLIADLISITSYCQLISSIFLSFCHISRYISSHIFSHQVGFERLLTEHSKLMWIHTRASNTNTNHLVRELNMYMYEIYIHIQNCFFCLNLLRNFKIPIVLYSDKVNGNIPLLMKSGNNW